ncbi:hypothetical protein [Paenibacillus sp. GYB003]|uniref:hypothetical protein n=1 Tax=Paenibacillus sp. GYB003 TaxID=2994392 RepID=UPI002F96B651
MNYRYAIGDESYEHLASGRVLYNRSGATAFPVRLASELFGRADAYLRAEGNPGPYRIYDPCAGGAYMLTSLGFLHGNRIASLTASDVDSQAVRLAELNLRLLTPEGLEERTEQLRRLHETYGKRSHEEAIASAAALGTMLGEGSRIRSVQCFEADATEPPTGALRDQTFDLVMSDVPYGNKVEWKTESAQPVSELLDRLAGRLAPVAVVVLIATKEQTIAHDRYDKVGQFRLGKRRAVFLRPK